jgi:hypothetical protein
MNVLSFLLVAFASFPSIGITSDVSPSAQLAQAGQVNFLTNEKGQVVNWDSNFGGTSLQCTSGPDKFMQGCNDSYNTLFEVEVTRSPAAPTCGIEKLSTTTIKKGVTPEQAREAHMPSEIMYCGFPSYDDCQHIYCKQNLQPNIALNGAGQGDVGGNPSAPGLSSALSSPAQLSQGKLPASNGPNFTSASAGNQSAGSIPSSMPTAGDQIAAIANGPQSSALPASISVQKPGTTGQVQAGSMLQPGDIVVLPGNQSASEAQLQLSQRLILPVTGFQQPGVVSTSQKGPWQQLLSFFFPK